MAAPVIKIKRSSVPGKIPTTASLPLGELALNTNDGKVYIQQDSVGIGSTVIVVNPWSVGLGSNTYNTFFTVGSVGIGTTVPTSSLHVVGNGKFTGVATATTFVGALTGTATSTTNIPNLTGAITSNNTTTSLGSFSSANLATALTDETGSGSAVFATSPTLVTPVLGAATATSIVVSSGSTFTNGPILVGTATSTGTASQKLQVTGGAYVSGNLGIGTTTPRATLNVVPTATSIAGLFSGTTSSDMVRITQLGTGNALVVEDSANPDSSPFVVSADGNLGVGTTNPSDKLHTLSGNIRVDSATGAVNFWSGAGYYGGIGVAGGLGGSGTDIVIRADTTRSIVFFTGGINDRGRIDSNGIFLVGSATSTGTASQRLQVTGGAYVSGNLGIGTINPTVALQLSPNASISNLNGNTNFGTTAGAAATVAQFYHLNGNASYLRIKATRNTAGADWTTASTKLLQVIDVTEQGYIEYNPSGSNYGMAFGSGATEWARFLLNGNLGIGTTNPTSKLHVVGDVRVTGIVTASAFSGDGSALTGITASGVVSVQISESAPGSPSVGDLWYNSSVGRIFIYYADDNSDQWVDAAPFNNGGGDGSVVISPLAPEGSVDGSLWFSTISARLFIYYNDGDSAQWIDAAPFNSSSSSVFDFPTGDYEDLSTSTIDAFNQNIGDISYDCLSYPLASLAVYDLGTI